MGSSFKNRFIYHNYNFVIIAISCHTVATSYNVTISLKMTIYRSCNFIFCNCDLVSHKSVFVSCTGILYLTMWLYLLKQYYISQLQLWFLFCKLQLYISQCDHISLKWIYILQLQRCISQLWLAVWLYISQCECDLTKWPRNCNFLT